LSYERSPDLGVITSYFNPCGFRTRAYNFERFAELLLASGISLVVVEASFDGEPFTLPARYPVLRIRGRDVMGHKERLLNVAAAHLPARCTKVAWLDADVIFERPDWALETSRRLDTHAVVQPFAEVVRLPRGHDRFQGEGEVWESFAAALVRAPQLLVRGDFQRHGHTGFAWAARRAIFEGAGLYDACIAGSGDHMMAHAFAGDWESPCIRRIVGPAGAHLTYFREWSRRVYALTRAKVSFVPGRLLHLWHGEMKNRRYVQRNQELFDLGFDPGGDIRVGDGGCWEWASDKPALHAWARRYFVERREDEGDEPAAPGEERA
jgi:hypothetical protein